ncbi:P-loop containing nucleoside triphosphate hydrolase protein [Microdochium trichocladiopsis]|uniref:RNA helicase n=1 Tax=Microdochium trichocladiopsis TaxID=1682393 RepID=A0A9P8YHJ3_9PEZI|nr:P-loop containing nucleoside triphosphate hydrolase protein [Microdochium trichocladiopsis]KAH7038063.1 P-loop containing nucleoside triphosphate hydrolase protein [Microdochium trichocladiopsis]
MKRKLNENDQPTPVAAAVETENPASTTTQADFAFPDFGLDSKLLQSVAHQKWGKPTLVQSRAIPLIMDGSDVLAKAKTGSGKTAAYLLPILHAILKRKQTVTKPSTAALILCPTRELVDQVSKNIATLTAFCTKEVQTVKLADKQSDTVQRTLLSASPDIVVATPARAWQNIKSNSMSIENLDHLVLDEADLVLSYGYDEDLRSVAAALPKGVQTVLMSATLTTEIDTLKGLFCRNPTVLDLEEADADGEGISQYVVKCAEDEKFLLMYVVFKLKLITGKCIIFVSDVDRSYRLKLFFEQFGIRSCVLNSELPVNSRIHCVEQFNSNVYDILIASDENEVLGDEDTQGVGPSNNHDSEPTSKEQAPPQKKRKASRRDKEYGISRGIDFVRVACVVNFDLPTSSKSYTHRIGRTGRAGQTGMAISFVIPSDKFRKHMPTSVETAENDEKILARITKQQAKKGKEIKDYSFDMKQVEAFRYRMNDALRAVTKVAVREARTREIRSELLKSEKLKRHFEENPAELQHVRHDGELRSARTNPELRHVPDYLLPKEGKKAITPNDVGYVPFKKVRDGKQRKGRSFKGKGRKMGGRKTDPLKSFKARSKR